MVLNWRNPITLGLICAALAGILLAAMPAHGGTRAQTGDTWIYNPATGHRYRLTPEGDHITWAAAEAQARAWDGHLVTINDAAEEAWLLAQFGGDEGFWIGLNDRASEGDWVWSSGEPVTHEHWCPGEPNNVGDEDAALFDQWPYDDPNPTEHCWNDVPESQGHRGIVEMIPPPIILVHGWYGLPGMPTSRCSEGIRRAGTPGVTDHTFGDMPQWFVDAGYDVWLAHIDTGPALGGTPLIETNAQCLRDQVAHVRSQTGQDVVLVAHSMGGLVSRACLSYSDCRANVKALYTLGSPHAGINTGFLIKLLTLLKAQVATHALCTWQPAMCQMTTDRMLLFDRMHPNRPGVAYRFVGGGKTPFVTGWLLFPLEGHNDGIVGRSSAVGWLYPLKLSPIPGPEPGRYWTDETHTGTLGHPSYFEPAPQGQPDSQAFRCVSSQLAQEPLAGCDDATTTLRLGIAGASPFLPASTISQMGHIASGQHPTHTLHIDTGGHSQFYLSWVSGTLTFTLTQPGGLDITPDYAGAHSDVVTYTSGLGGSIVPPLATYAFTETVPGLYTITVGAESLPTEGTDYLLFAALDASRSLSVTTDADLYQAGDTATFTGTLHGPSGGIAGASVHGELTRADGLTDTLAFADLGDGTYGATYLVPDAPGQLEGTYTAAGTDGGTEFTRQIEGLLAVAPHDAQLAGTFADELQDRDSDGRDDTLAVDVGLEATRAGTYTLAADLFAGGQTVAHAVGDAPLTTDVQTVTLRFDGWEIRRSRTDGPYTLTHLYLIDLDAGGIPAQTADNVWLTDGYRWSDFAPKHVHYLPVVLRGG